MTICREIGDLLHTMFWRGASLEDAADEKPGSSKILTEIA